MGSYQIVPFQQRDAVTTEADSGKYPCFQKTRFVLQNQLFSDVSYYCEIVSKIQLCFEVKVLEFKF